MNIEHYVTFRYTPDKEKLLQRIGELDIKYNDSALRNPFSPFIVFTILESDHRWPNVQKLMKKYGGSELVSTKFSKAELKSTEWLVMKSTGQKGYPMPKDSNFETLTYDLSTMCPKCWVGRRQNNPFSMDGEPKWGSHGILQLNWIYDEYFAKPDVWKNIFMSFGIETRPVLNYKNKKELKGVLQLKIDDTNTYAFDFSKTPKNITDYEKCGKCKNKKYLGISRGFFPKLIEKPKNKFLIKSTQYFGRGGVAVHEVIIHNDLWKKIDENKIKGVKFIPVENS